MSGCEILGREAVMTEYGDFVREDAIVLKLNVVVVTQICDYPEKPMNYIF